MKSFLDPYNPAFWLFTSLAVAILATNGAGQIGKLIGTRGKPADATRSALRPLAWLLISLFFLLPPPGAWRFGAISPRLMGLAGIDWVESLRSGVALGFLIVGVLLFGWLIYRHSLPGERDRTPASRAGAMLRAPVDAALLQWHWAFYRALAIALVPVAASALMNSEFLLPLGRGLAGAPLYWGSWLGLGLVALEWALNPFTRAGLRQRGRREIALLRVVMAIATTALFVLAANFWLPLACHLVIETVIAGWFPLPK